MFGKLYIGAIAMAMGVVYSLCALISVVPGGVKTIGLGTDHTTGNVYIFDSKDCYGNPSNEAAVQFVDWVIQTDYVVSNNSSR